MNGAYKCIHARFFFLMLNVFIIYISLIVILFSYYTLGLDSPTSIEFISMTESMGHDSLVLSSDFVHLGNSIKRHA